MTTNFLCLVTERTELILIIYVCSLYNKLLTLVFQTLLMKFCSEILQFFWSESSNNYLCVGKRTCNSYLCHGFATVSTPYWECAGW